MLQVNTTAMTDARPLPAKSRTSASLDGFVPNAKTCPRRPPTTPVSRIRPCGPNKRPSEGLSSLTRKTYPCRPSIGRSRRLWTTFASDMENLSAHDRRRPFTGRLDSLGSNHGDHVRGGHVVPHPIRIFSETESLRTGESRPYHL